MDIFQHLKELSLLQTIVLFCVVGTVGSIVWWLIQWIIVVIAGLLLRGKK